MITTRDLLKNIARRLRRRSEEDMLLATTKLSDKESFAYVCGRARTLEVVAQEIEAALEERETPEG